MQSHGGGLELLAGMKNLQTLRIRSRGVSDGGLKCRVVTGGELASRKGINVPGATLRFPALTDKDKEDATFALEQGVDFMALSFVCRAADVRELRRFLNGRDGYVPIIAKIEKPEDA